jgi:hypothetical protein
MKWLRENQPGSLLFAPIVFPLIFALMFYEQYRIQFVMAALERLAGLFEKKLGGTGEGPRLAG